jgi:epoxyqueuosine reductase
MDTLGLTELLKDRAGELGFSLCGVCPAVPPPGLGRFDEWLAAGYAGQMHYLADRRDAYNRPQSVLDGARSILMLALNYQTAKPTTCQPGQGRVSRYAWGTADYHDLIHGRLSILADWLRAQVSGACVRGVVDTAPLMEREFAQLAGLGWIGKHTLLLNRRLGSWFFLAALLTDLELEYDAPHTADHCGTCRACLDACPTSAFPRPHVLDATRCISYLTIELKEAIPVEKRSSIGDWLFGCDICQEVCPWNNDAPTTGEHAFQPVKDNNPLDLVALFDLDEPAFRKRFRHTPLWRPKRRGLLRNAAIILGNHRTSAAIPALVKGLNDDDPLVRASSSWALGNYSETLAGRALQSRQAIEEDSMVLAEIAAALKCRLEPKTSKN